MTSEEACHPPPREARPLHSDGSTPRGSWPVPPTWRPTGNNHTAGYRKNPHSGQNFGIPPNHSIPPTNKVTSSCRQGKVMQALMISLADVFTLVLYRGE